MRTYDPSQVSVSFNNLVLDGFGPDTLIKVSRDEDGYTLQIGNSGTGARSRNPNKAGTIEVTLLNSSPMNAAMSAIAEADELTGAGVGPFLVKDRTTLTAQCTAQNAWIQKMPDWERAKELGVTVWTLRSDKIDIVHDGVDDT